MLIIMCACFRERETDREREGEDGVRWWSGGRGKGAWPRGYKYCALGVT